MGIEMNKKPTSRSPNTAWLTGWEDGLEAEQVVEPVAWTLTETLDKRVTTTRGHLWFSDPVNCCWTPLYLHPAPPSGERDHCEDALNMVGERSELIKELRLLKFHVGGGIGDIVNRAADMLEADAREIEGMRKMYEQAHRGRADFRQAFREARKAQQVVVQPGYVLVPIIATPEMIAAAEQVEDLYKRGTPDTWGKVYCAMIQEV